MSNLANPVGSKNENVNNSIVLLKLAAPNPWVETLNQFESA